MQKMALLLKQHIVKNNLYTAIVGKNYAHVEGWQFAGGMMGLYPKVISVENLSSGTEYKWKAEVQIINQKTGAVVSSGFAVCSNKENKKAKFDEYAILSMAQTRAIGKAFRNLLGWVMKLAGYEGIPKEEMVKVGEEAKEKQTDSGILATQSQKSTIEKLCKEMKLSDPEKAFDYIQKATGIQLTDTLTKEQASKIIATLLKKQVAKR